MEPKSAIDPAGYDKPASWTGVLIDFVLRNGTGRTVTPEWGLTVTSDPDDSQGDFVIPDTPGAVGGISWVGESPLLASRRRKGTSGVVVASASGIVLTSAGDDKYSEVSFVGDAT